jgi:antitoxin component YwqK of YwqJK toxin-antitoxin module
MKKLLVSCFVCLGLAACPTKEIRKEYYDDGVLKSEFSYKNGIREGIARIYGEDGVLEVEVIYANDKPTEGWLMEKDTSGKYKRGQKFNNTQLEAIFLWYND